MLDFLHRLKSTAEKGFCAILLFSALIFYACGNNDSEVLEVPDELSASQKSELCYLRFYQIDNEVKIYVNGELVDDSGIIEKEEVDYVVPLTDYLTSGSNRIVVELYNGNGVSTTDKSWEVYYELFYNQVPVDYRNEQSDNGKTGLVYTMDHEITIQ